MTVFKKGDRVRVTGGYAYDQKDNATGTVAHVYVSVNGALPYPYEVELDDRDYELLFAADELELVTDEEI